MSALMSILRIDRRTGCPVHRQRRQGAARPYFERYTVGSGGSLSYNVYDNPSPGNYCPYNRSCELRGIAMGKRPSLNSPPRLYLAGTRQASGSDWDYLVMEVDASGVPQPAFSDDGVTTISVSPGGNNDDAANAIVVVPGGALSEDQIYLVGNVAQTCKDGVGVAKLTRAGALDRTFGERLGAISGRSGIKIVGGSNASLCPLSFSEDFADAATIQDGRLAIAGFRESPFPGFCIPGQPCPEDNVDGLVTILDGATGDILSSDDYAYRASVDGPRSRHSSFHGIVGSGNGSFTMAGRARFFEPDGGLDSGASQYASFRIKSDVLFKNGFDAN